MFNNKRLKKLELYVFGQKRECIRNNFSSDEYLPAIAGIDDILDVLQRSLNYEKKENQKLKAIVNELVDYVYRNEK